MLSDKLKNHAKDLIIKSFKAAYSCLLRFVPLSDDIIIFESSTGNDFSGNPRAIYEEMLRRSLHKKYRCLVSLKDPSILLPKGITPVKRRSLRYFYIFGRARIWISDSRMPLYLVKRKSVAYIQTWHGTPLKKLGLDMDKISMAGFTDIDRYHRNFKANSSYWDYLITQNPYSTQIFKRCFDFHGKFLETGYPRCDKLFKKNNPRDISDIKKRLGLPTGKKIILYAPTWRDDEYIGKNDYKYTDAMDFKALKEAFGDECVFLLKYHYFVTEKADISEYEGFVYDFSKEADISDLYLAADACVTDYSSVMFDYCILNRPMYFYCYDLKHYKDDLRGFYFDFETKAPGPISTYAGGIPPPKGLSGKVPCL